MGTRGVYGFKKKVGDKTQKKVTYNHFDSYPSCLGKGIKDFIANTSNEELNEIFDKIILVEGDSKVIETTKEDILSIGINPKTEWYSYLRETQGILEFFKEKDFKYMIDDQEFLKDGLFCEWGYIYNIDTEELEVYKGLFESKKEGEYITKIIKKIPYSELQEFDMETLKS
jgi:hypothetical protein